MILRFPSLVAAAAVLAFVVAPSVAGAAPAPRCNATVGALQQRLQSLHFPVGALDGCAGIATRAALEAFQKANNLVADGVAGAATAAALAHPAPLRAADRSPGRHVEVDLARQLMTVVDNGAVSRAYSVSTGRPGFDTPTGTYRVGRKERRSWSVPYRVWMPYASYFTGGVAFHEGSTETARASHGCVHVPAPFARAIYELLTPGTTVIVGAGASPAPPRP